ncbi:MAG: methyltransferase domain-containing protein [Parvibaculaceae bacterium]
MTEAVKYENALSEGATSRFDCRLCKSQMLWKAIPLHPLPIASPNVGMASKSYQSASADVFQCEDCGFLQLSTIVDPEFQYRNFKYVTGISVGLREHFKILIDGLAAKEEIEKGKFVFDIGSNDGSLLVLAKARGADILGIDPAVKIATDATAAGIPTIGDFFTRDKAAEIVRDYRKADVVISNNTVANIDDLDGFFEGIAIVLAPKGILIIETQYALDLVEKTLLDVVYHEHISYFAVSPMQKFLARLGFELVDAERIEPKGGSIRFYAQLIGGGRPVSPNVARMIETESGVDGALSKASFAAFNARIAHIGEEIIKRLKASRAETGRALVYGSSVGCAALIHYFNLGEYIDAVFDDTPLMNYVRSPSGALPVLSGSQLLNEPPTDIAVLAWRYTENIAGRHAAYREAGGRFYRALPDLAYF